MAKVTAPRLVHMAKGDHGYGFNLHGEKNPNAGQTISAVDEGTPAHTGGLLVGDRLVEVNGVNIESCTHSQVVQKIKASGNQVTMLVVDAVTDAYLKNQERPITADMANLATVVPPPPETEEPSVQPEPEPEPVKQEREEEEEKPEEPAAETVQAETAENVVESAAPEVVDSTADQTETAPPPDEKPAEEAAKNEVDASKKYDLEKTEQPTTPEEVKQLNHVLNAEQNNEEIQKAAPPVEQVPVPEPAPKANDSNSNTFPSIELARQRSIPQRNRIKEKAQEGWAEKYKKFQNL